MNKKNKAIQEAIAIFGTQVQLARELKVTRGRVWQWLHDFSNVSPEIAIAIEEKTNGIVRCEDLRPDINWSVLRNKKATKAN